jgi:hypothetical protein
MQVEGNCQYRNYHENVKIRYLTQAGFAPFTCYEITDGQYMEYAIIAPKPNKNLYH